MRKYENIHEEIKDEFSETVDDLITSYGKSVDDANLIVSTVIVNAMKKLQIDSKELGFLDFYKKHIHNLEVLYHSDFTVSQIEKIISESPISDDEKKIARKLYVEAKTYNTTAGECYISEPRTVASKKEKISSSLRKTAVRMTKIQGN